MSVSASAELTINGDASKGSLNGTIQGSIETAFFIASQAKALAPVNTARLRNSISVKQFDGKSKLFNDGAGKKANNKDKISLNPEKETIAYVGTNVNKYPVYQEFGTRYQKPQPYMRPAGALAKGSSVKSVITKIHEEEMAGALKEGRKIVQF